jgi:hypothetical protein
MTHLEVHLNMTHLGGVHIKTILPMRRYMARLRIFHLQSMADKAVLLLMLLRDTSGDLHTLILRLIALGNILNEVEPYGIIQRVG